MRPSCEYDPIDVSQAFALRGTNQQTDTALLWQPPAYKAFATGQSPGVSTLRFPGLILGAYALQNRSGSTIACGIGVRIPNYLWKFGLWTDGTTTFTDDTTDAQDVGTDDAVLDSTTNNDGHVILSRVPFNAVSYNISTAGSGGTAVRAVRFSNAAGSAWATATTNLQIHHGASGNYTTGEQLIVFAPPVTWGKSSALATGIGDGYYAMNVRSTTAPSSAAAKATAIEIFRLYQVTEGLADNGLIEDSFGAGEVAMARDTVEGLYGDALVALFGTANDGNRVHALVRAA